MLWQQWPAAVSAALAAAAAAVGLGSGFGCMACAAWLGWCGFAGAGHLTVMIGTAECSAMRTAPSIPAGIWTPSCMAVRKAGETSAPFSGMAGGMG